MLASTATRREAALQLVRLSAWHPLLTLDGTSTPRAPTSSLTSLFADLVAFEPPQLKTLPTLRR